AGGNSLLILGPSRHRATLITCNYANGKAPSSERGGQGANASSASLGDGRACLERAGSSQPRLRHVEGSREIGLHTALRKPLNDFLTLMGCQSLRTAKSHATLLGALPAIIGAGSDQLALEFSEASEHSQHQAAMRRSCIGPGVLERTEASAGLTDCIEDVEQIACRARQPIEASDDQNITVLQPANRLCQLGPIGLRARGLLLEDVPAASGLQIGDLAGEVLIPRRHPRISESSHLHLPLLKGTFRLTKRREMAVNN